MRHSIYCCFALYANFQMAVANPSEAIFCAKKHELLKETEPVILTSVNMQITARVDTGAGKSSLHAKDIKLLEEKNQNYVQFCLIDDHGKSYQMKKKLQYIAEITNTSGISEKRYVVRTKIILKNKKYTIDVNLKDRSNMQYKFLIGRDIIKKGEFIVNVI